MLRPGNLTLNSYLGPYKVLFREENWDYLKKENGILKRKNGSNAYGLTTVKLLAHPDEMLLPNYPFVGFKVMSKGKETTQYSLCYSCAKTGNTQVCFHSADERAFVVNRPIHFINEAVFWGYTIEEIYETHLYENGQCVFEDFMAAAEEFQGMNNDDFYKKLTKIGLCSAIGKLASRPPESQTILCYSNKDLKKELSQNFNKITDVKIVNEMVCEVTKKNDIDNRLKSGTNLSLNAYVTASAHILIWRKLYDIMKLAKSCVILKISTGKFFYLGYFIHTHLNQKVN